MKKYSELYTVDEFIEYYRGASKRELRDAMKSIKRVFQSEKNRKKTIESLLA